MGHNQVFKVETCHKRGNYSKPNDKGRLYGFRQSQGDKAFPVPNRKRARKPAALANSGTASANDPDNQ